jgi:hypothetical protein
MGTIPKRRANEGRIEVFFLGFRMSLKLVYFTIEMKKPLFLLLLWLPATVFAQIGGRHVFNFLNLTPAARVASLGGANVSTRDYDANFAYLNPALTNDSMSKQISFSIVNYLADITYGYTSYAHSIKNVADFHAGIQYVSYGKMIEADEYGNQLGEFGATDIAIVVGAARKFNMFRGGVNLKFINSSISGYQSNSALAMDLGGLYESDNGLFSAGMVFKNIGFNLGKFNVAEGENTPLPFESQIGVSARLRHLPLRFSLTATNLQNPNLIYQDPNPEPQFDLSGNPIVPKKQTGDKIFRHFVFGGEFLLSKGLNLRMGYNHLIRQELRNVNRGGLSGFSFGAGVRVAKFRLDYGLCSFHAVGTTHNFSISTNIGGFKKKSL